MKIYYIAVLIPCITFLIAPGNTEEITDTMACFKAQGDCVKKDCVLLKQIGTCDRQLLCCKGLAWQ
uniref:Beta-defensin-like protein 8 n=1 Tax=Anolis carolinensis TaxID=28377 RepID=G7ZL96_ANOCA|nr:beta-defensin-like protein 8 [Anolis carolinensis]